MRFSVAVWLLLATSVAGAEQLAVKSYGPADGLPAAFIQQVMRDDFGIVGPGPQVLPGPPGIFEPGHQFNKADKFHSVAPDWSPQPLAEGLRATIPWYLDYLRPTG